MKQARKRFLSLLLVLCMLLGLIPSVGISALAADAPLNAGVTLPSSYRGEYDMATQSTDVVISSGGAYRLWGTKGGLSVIVTTEAKVTLVLEGLKLTNSKSPIQLKTGADVTLVLLDGTQNDITCTVTDTAGKETASGMTAGINVPEGATLTVDKEAGKSGNGSLTVQGGYGGAGIGGGAATSGYTDERGLTGANGGNGMSAAGLKGLAGGYGGSGGSGGAGGRHGKDAEKTGSIVICAGALTVTGGENAAGIGGGRGADGEDGEQGNNAVNNAGQGQGSKNGIPRATGGGGGGSGGNGGNGGNGGKGGSLTNLTVTGGTLTVTGGTHAAGIGGGAGGNGGNGGLGGAGAPGAPGGYSVADYGDSKSEIIGARGGNGATGATGFRGASPGGDGGVVRITGGSVDACGYVAVGAGRTKWPDKLSYNSGTRGGYPTPRNVSSNYATLGGNGGSNNYNTRPEPVADNGILTIQNASVQLADKVPADELKDDLTQPNYFVRPVDANGDLLYRMDITVKRLDRVTTVGGADLSLVLHRGDGAKQYSFAVKSDAQGIATLWLPEMKKVSETGVVKTDYQLYAEGNEVAHRAVGRILPDVSFGIEVKSVDTNKMEIYIGVDYTARSTPNASKVYRSVDTTTYGLKLDDTRGTVDLVIDARTVPEDMNIIELRWFREAINGNTDEYDFYAHGNKKEYMTQGFAVAKANNPANTGSSDATEQASGSAAIDMTPEQAVAGVKPRVWNLPMRENGRYWVQLTYQVPGEEPQKLVKGVVINNLYTSYPLWFHSRYVTEDNQTTALNWFDGGASSHVLLKEANGTTWTQPYGIPWDLDAYDAAAMRNSTVDSTLASKILTSDNLLQTNEDAGVVGGYDTVSINMLDRYLTFYNALVGNDGDGNPRWSLNTGSHSRPYTMTLNADFFSNATTQYGEIIGGKQTFNKFLVTYMLRDGTMNIVFITGVDENGAQLWDLTSVYAMHILDATVNAWDRPGYKLVGVEYAGGSGAWQNVTNRQDTLTDNIDDNKDKIVTEIDKMRVYFGDISTVKQVKFTYKKSTTDVTVKAYYQVDEGEAERAIEGFVPYVVEAEFGKDYEPKTLVIDGYKLVDDNLKNGKISVVDPSTLPEGERAEANVVKFYFVKETGNVTYRAVLKGADGAQDEYVWSEDRTVDRDTVPTLATDASDTKVLPTLKNFIPKTDDAGKLTVSITRKDTGAAATQYDGVHDLYVTYEYVKRTKDVTVKAIDQLTKQPIELPANEATRTLATGENHSIDAPVIADYTLIGENSQSFFLDADDPNPTVTFYYVSSDKAEVSVKLYYTTRDENGEVENTIQILRSEVEWGGSVTIQAPNLQGYEIVANQPGVTKTDDGGEVKYSITLNPTRTKNADGGYDTAGTEVKVQYTKAATIDVKIKLVDSADAANDLSLQLTGWTHTIEVEEGKSATATAPSIPNYKLAQGEDVEKTLAWTDIQQAITDGNQPTITFIYEKAEADLITITVEGKTAAGEPLYSYTKDARKSSTAVEIEIFAENGHKLDSVQMNGADVPKVGDVYTIDPNGQAQTVTATYSENLADVTINAYYEGTNDMVDGFSPFTVKAEIGKPYSYGTLTLAGHDPVGTEPKIGSVAAQDNVLNYYFTRQSGNVIYRLVEDGNETNVLATKSITVAKDATIDKSYTLAPTATNWKLKDSSDGTAAVGTTPVDTYDGVRTVTVTYIAVPKTKSVSIHKLDVDTDAVIESVNVELQTGKIHTLKKADYLPADYTISGLQQVEVYVEDDNQQRSVNMYFRHSTDQDVTVKLVYQKDGTDHEIQTYVVQRKPGTAITVKAPDMAYKGYTAVKDSELVPADKSEVTLYYTVTYYEVKIVLENEDGVQLVAPAGYELTRQVRKGEGIVLTAPSITDYTLTSALVVSKTAAELEQEANRTITFTYQNTAKSNYVTHTIILMINNVEKVRYSSIVAKGEGTTTYYAPAQNGYQVDHMTQDVSNAESKEVVFIYTDAAATITVKHVDERGNPIAGVDDKVLTGYEKGQTVLVPAPVVSNMALAGEWKNGSLGDMTGKSAVEVTIGKNNANAEVTFAYKPIGSAFVFHLYGTDGREIKTVLGGVNDTMSTAAGGNLNLDASGYTFLHGDENNTAPFTGENASLKLTAETTPHEYYLHYFRATRWVKYNYVDANGNPLPEELTKNLLDSASCFIYEQLTVTAPEIPGYSPLTLTQRVDVIPGDGEQQVTISYRVKDTGSVTVEHIVKLAGGAEKIFATYEASSTQGEWFSASALAHDVDGITADGKYKFTESATNKAAQTVRVTAVAQTIKFYYEPNYVNVSVYTSIKGNETEHQTGLELAKTAAGKLELYAPSRDGHVLKGIEVISGGNTVGSADTFPAAGWSNNTLTLNGADYTADVKVVYHYVPIKDVVGDEQATVTVNDVYETYNLTRAWSKVVIKGVADSITPKSYTDYVLIAYKVGDSEKQTLATGQGDSFVLNNTFDQDTNVTFFYARRDGSAVVPGGNGTFGDTDDVVIKPTATQNPTVNGDGSVNVPDGGEVVVPGVGVIVPPNGSIVRPDGTIVAPDENSSTTPGVTVNPNKPGETAGYISVTYHANGGEGESYTQMTTKGASITLIAVADRFVKTGFKGTGWNTNDKGLGEPYTAGTPIADKSLVLYAQWEEDKDPTTDPNRYKGTIVLKPNGGNGVNETINVSSNTANPILHKLPANTFALDGWTFAYWLNDSGKVVKDTEIVEVADKATLTLTAQWFSKNADGSITVPGKDGIPNNTDDVTAKPNPNPGEGVDGSLTRNPDTGVITVPGGGSVIDKDGTEIAMPNGGTLKPDGTITIKQPNGPDIVVKPDGSTEPTEPGKTVYTLTYKSGVTDVKDVKVYYTDSVTVSADAMTREGYKLGQWLNGNDPVPFGTDISKTTTLTAKWYKVNDDGSVTVPGKDGSIDPDNGNDNVTVKPGTDGKTPDVDNNGNVVVPPADGSGTGTVTTPDGELVVPGGSKVDPDGTITDPDNKQLYPSTDPDDPNKTPDGYFKVTYKSGESGVDNQKDVIQLVKTGEKATILAGGIFASANKVFIGWKDGEGRVVEMTTHLSETTVLTAQWKATGSVILALADDAKIKDGVGGEKKLVLRGDWANEANYTISVLVDSKPAGADEVYWNVDASSYAEYGFTNSALKGTDIISIDAKTGKITVKNSGIVRITCTSMVDPTASVSVTIIVPGDVNKDGRVNIFDVDWIYNAIDTSIPQGDYIEDLADLTCDGNVNVFDVDALYNLVDKLAKI